MSNQVCSFLNNNNNKLSNTNLIYPSAKPVLNRFLSPVSQTEDSFYILTCSISSGTKPISFAWKYNNRPLLQSNDFTIETNDQFSFLKLSQVKRSHAGNYTCLARNNEGLDEAQVHLLVKGDVSVVKYVCLMPKVASMFTKEWRQLSECFQVK